MVSACGPACSPFLDHFKLLDLSVGYLLPPWCYMYLCTLGPTLYCSIQVWGEICMLSLTNLCSSSEFLYLLQNMILWPKWYSNNQTDNKLHSKYTGTALYEGCSKWIAYFYLETSNFKLAQKYSFHALEVLPVTRNAKFQLMCPLLEGVTVCWFWHSNKVLMNGRSKCLSGLVLPPSKECFQFRKQKEITWGKVWGIRGVRQNSYFFFLQKRRNYCGGMSWCIVM